MDVKHRVICAKDNQKLAKIIRDNLKAYKLDIPGTVYFDDNLDHLSDYYLAKPEARVYFVLCDESDDVVGGVSLAQVDFMDETCELQKLYLREDFKGKGLSYLLMELVEKKALELGYRRVYLETHSNLVQAIHLYEKCGFVEIARPKEVVHSTMDRFFIKEL